MSRGIECCDMHMVILILQNVIIAGDESYVMNLYDLKNKDTVLVVS